MPTNTPIYSLPYPALTDPPNVPTDIKNLATATETALSTQVAKLTPGFARYYKTSTQSPLTLGTATGVQFDVEQTASSAITPNANRSQFTVKTAGIWSVSTGIRILSAGWTTGSASFRLEGLVAICPTASDLSARYAANNSMVIQDTNYQGAATFMPAVTLTRHFNVNDTIAVNGVLNSTPTSAFTWQLTPFGEQVFVAFTLDARD